MKPLMYLLPKLLSLILLLGTWPTMAHDAQPVDIITMHNGDIYHGTVTQEFFDLETDFGRLSIPYARIAHLHNENSTTHIHTRDGSLITGTLVQEQFTVMRRFETSLPLHNHDIATIEFGPWPQPRTVRHGADLITFTNGDHLRLDILTDPWMLKHEDGLKLLPGKRIQTLDLEQRDLPDSAPALMVRFNGHEAPLLGELMNSHIDVRTFKQALAIPPALIERISLKHFHRNQAFNGPPRAPYLRDRFRDGSLGPELVIVRGGQFQRGDLQGDGDSDEQPATLTTLPGPFAISTHEITFEEFDRFCESTRHPKPDDGGWGRGRRPVINVNWQEALDYTRWLSAMTGHTYRLPTDAEWEYAARGGSSTRYWWGNENERARAICTGCGSLWDGEKSAPVGRFAPNPYGLFDMLGNVWEWVGDCYHDRFAEAPADGSVLDKPGCGKRVIRGGAWSFPAREMRSANRWRDFPSRRSDDTGFRVARELRYE